MRIILASASPRRAELLREAGVAFDVIVSPKEEPEKKPAGIPTELWPICLAYMKAAAVREKLKTQNSKRKAVAILAADTIVVNAGKILNKARNRAHARQMLLSLRGNAHRVITGMAIFKGDEIRLFSATAICHVKKFPKALLESYLDSGLWRGKAGAYGIQDHHDPFVELVSGDINTAIGLPVELVLSELAALEG